MYPRKHVGSLEYECAKPFYTIKFDILIGLIPKKLNISCREYASSNHSAVTWSPRRLKSSGTRTFALPSHKGSEKQLISQSSGLCKGI